MQNYKPIIKDIDLHETLKNLIGSEYDDDYLLAQRGADNTIAGKERQTGTTAAKPQIGNGVLAAAQQRKISFDDKYFVFDTRQIQSENRAFGSFTFDIATYLRQYNTAEFNLNNIIEAEIYEPFYIPKLLQDEAFNFDRVLIRVQEITSSVVSSANVAPPHHFDLIATDTGKGRFLLTPARGKFIVYQPIRLNNVTLNFFTPLNYNSSIAFPPTSVPATYTGFTGTTTVFSVPLDSGLVVGDVVVFTYDVPAAVAANPIFFRDAGHFIVSVLPLSFEISGSFDLTATIPFGSVLTAYPQSRIIRVPIRFRLARTGDGNFITAT